MPAACSTEFSVVPYDPSPELKPPRHERSGRRLYLGQCYDR